MGASVCALARDSFTTVTRKMPVPQRVSFFVALFLARPSGTGKMPVPQK